MKIALDCEMIGDVHGRSMLARVTLVDEDEQVIYNTFVKATREVGTYRYELTGINESHFKNAKDFNQVKQDVKNKLSGCILIGHSVPGDLEILGLEHPARNVRDIAEYPGYKRSNGQKRTLKDLAKEYLGMDIQINYHDSVEDAKASMKLYKRLYSDKTHLKNILRQAQDIFGDESAEICWNLPIQPSFAHFEAAKISHIIRNEEEQEKEINLISSQSVPSHPIVPPEHMIPRTFCSSNKNKKKLKSKKKQMKKIFYEENVMTMADGQDFHSQPSENNNQHTSESKPLINITCRDKKFVGLIDSGAAVSVVSKDTVNRIHQRIDESDMKLKAVDGKELSVIGKVNLKLLIDNVLFIHDFLVVENISHNLILGQDFLLRNNAIVDFYNEQLIIKHIKCKFKRQYMQMNKENDSDNSVYDENLYYAE
ncbi:hypothetical protein evm_015080 [Chilo suppressalis]|nr:hypothetical protein evm_015080 [Chilo suppressalis]